MTEQALFDLCAFDAPTCTLARLYCGKSDLQTLGRWLSETDFEALPTDLSCMAANAASEDFSQMPQTLVPRLRGILKYVHTLNAGMTAGFLSLATQWQAQGISAVLLEDTALALCAPEGGRRQLWQLRIGISRKDYQKAVAMAQESGWLGEASPWAATLKQSQTRQITLFPLEDGSYYWQANTMRKFGNVSLLCPEPAALLMGLCQLGFRALTKQAPRAAMVHWLMDMKLLLSLFEEAHWQRALQLAKAENALFHMGLLLHIYEAISGSAVNAAAFCGLEEAAHTAKLLKAFRASEEKGQKGRRLYLLYRLRRPDSVGASLKLLLRELQKKYNN